MTLDADEIKGYLRRNFGIDPQNSPIFADRFYDCPTPEWFYGEFAGRLRDFWKGIRPPWYRRWFVPDSWDCDDFARGAAWFAQVLHRQADGKGAKAVGEFWYYRNADPSDEHAIVIAVFGPESVGFLEPQSNKDVLIRADEKSTWYRF